MGRVSKHKKIKSCDPFFKGPRKNPVRKGDLPPPNDEDQPAPKSLLRLLKFGEQVASRKKVASQKHETAVLQKTSRKRTKLSKTDPDLPQREVSKPESSITSNSLVATGDESAAVPRQGRAAMFVRRPGESTRDYLERIDIESKFRIASCYKKERRKSDKRKRYLEERKKKLKSRKQHHVDSFKDFNDFKDDVRFNEVVQAPPQLSAKPRGSGKKAKQTPKLNLPGFSTSSEEVVATAGQVGLKHKQDMEEERVRAIEEYRLAKKLKVSLKDRTTKP